MNKTIVPFIEYFAEAATACLVTMVQGNMLAVTPIIWHKGSNGRWFAELVVAKDRNGAVFVATNSNSRAAVEDMINVMITRFEAR